MRRTLLVLVLLALMASQASTANAATVTMGGELSVSYEPDSLTLAPGEEGVVHLDVENTGDRTLWVGIAFVRIESPWGSSGEVTPDYFQLGPGDSQSVRVTVTSHADYRRSDPGDSEGTLKFWWGPNLTREQDGDFDRVTAVGDQWLTIPVEDDFSAARTSVVLLLAVMALMIVLAVAILLYDRRRRRRATALDEGPGGAPGHGPPDT